MTRLTISALLLLLVQQVNAAAIDTAHSQIGFTLKQMNSPMEGQFKRFSGTATLDVKNPAAGRADISINIASISLPTAEASAETQKKDWFDTAKYPSARFVTSSIKPLGGNRFQFTGKLTLKGVTRDVSAPFSAREQGALTLVEGSLPISRLAYKIGEGDWADTDTVADLVQIRFRIAIPVNHK